jgi:alanine-alpha-ketoisovalerate/valine-pyruvate aminotransferase
MAKATSDALGSLHEELAKVLTKAIKEGVPMKDDEGNVYVAPAPAAILNVARQFLKDNNIDCAPEATNPIGLLKEASLPFSDSVVPLRKAQ